MPKLLYPPLDKFLVVFTFNPIENPSFDDAKKLFEELGTNYPNPMKLSLHPMNVLSRPPVLGLGPMKLVSKNKDHEIQLYQDAIMFLYNKDYTSWDNIFPVIIESLNVLIRTLGIEIFQEIRLEYTDIFNLKRKNFSLKQYFTFYPEFPVSFDLDYTDYTSGIKLKLEEESETFIIRLKARNPNDEDTYLIILETLYMSKKPINVSKDIEILKRSLEKMHDTISENFISLLKKKTKTIIGMQLDEEDE